MALGAKGHRDSPEVAKRLGAQSPRPPCPGGPQLPVGRVPNTTLIFDNLPKGRNSLKADILTVTAGYREGYRLKSAEGRDAGGRVLGEEGRNWSERCRSEMAWG